LLKPVFFNGRVSVLKNLKQLVQNVLGSSQGKIYLSSADVSDTDVKYVLSLAGEYQVNPFVIVNNYRHVAGNCYNYSGSNPKNLIAALDKAIYKGGHHLLCCEDGYTIIDADDADEDDSGAVIESVKAASEQLYAAECKAIADSPTISDAELKKLQDTRAKTKTERHQQRKAELSRRYEIDVTSELVEKDDNGWYPQLRMHYYLTLGREFLTNRDAKRAKAQLEAGENSVWKPDFNKGQLLPAVLLLESLNLLQFLTPEVRLRSSDEKMLEFKAVAVQHRHVIKKYLHVSISEKHTPIAIAQKLLAKIDLKLNYVGRLGKRENRECVYQFVAPDDQRDSIFGQWLNRDEASNQFAIDNSQFAVKTIANCELFGVSQQ
jgi:hypothetical protein